MIWYALGIYFAGIVTGIISVRYGIGLGIKTVYQIKEDMPTATWHAGTNTEQSYTGDEDAEV